MSLNIQSLVRHSLAAAGVIIGLGLAAEAHAGVTGPAFYVDGVLYRTVGTPALLPDAAPDDSFDTIYVLGQCQSRNVANASPGDTDFNGGRWEVHLIAFDDCLTAIVNHDVNLSGDLDSAAEVQAALEAGNAIDRGVVTRFECPVIPLPKNEG